MQFRHYGARGRFHGPVRTVKTFEDNALIRQMLSTPGSGAVLVVDGGGSLRCALVGDVLAGLGRQNGWAGLVVWGAVRDTAALAGLDLGIKGARLQPVEERQDRIRAGGRAGALWRCDVPPRRLALQRRGRDRRERQPPLIGAQGPSHRDHDLDRALPPPDRREGRPGSDHLLERLHRDGADDVVPAAP